MKSHEAITEYRVKKWSV